MGVKDFMTTLNYASCNEDWRSEWDALKIKPDFQEAINNKHLNDFIAKFVDLFKPDSIFVCNDSEEDIQYVRDKAIKDGEEAKLAVPGHTVHFDSIYDQARDKARTKFLVPKGQDFGKGLNIIDKDELDLISRI